MTTETSRVGTPAGPLPQAANARPLAAPITDFENLDGVIHLAAGAESPPLRTQRAALAAFLALKGRSGIGAPGANEKQAVYDRCKANAAALFGVPPTMVAFSGSVADATSQIALSLPWQAGDSVIVEDVEFLSALLPWTRLGARGVQVRIVRHADWTPEERHIQAAVDTSTRLIAVSQVNYLTGVQHNLAALRAIAHAAGAKLFVDMSHAAGVVATPAALCDFAVSATYKWLLGCQGVALLVWNRERVPELEPAVAGWRSVEEGLGGGDPRALPWKATAERLEAGNPPTLAIFYLDAALAYLHALGLERISAHAATLSARMHAGLSALGLPLATPADPRWRAGNICYWTETPERIAAALAARGILVSGYAGRMRFSTHLWNSETEVDACLAALAEIVAA